MNRRTWFGLATGVAGLAAGAGVWVRSRAPAAPAPAPAAAASAAGPDDLRSLSFERPEGGTLALGTLRDRPLLINFWATWCPPCVREMPQIDRFAQEQAARGDRGWRVIGLAVDGPTPVREFLARTPVGFPIGLAGFGGTELARRLGNTQGGLPFTVVLAPDDHVMHVKLGETHLEELQAWAATGTAGTAR